MLINRNNTALCRTVSYYTILCDTTITYTVSDILHCPVLYYFLLCCSEAHCGIEEIPYLHISHLLSLTLTLSLYLLVFISPSLPLFSLSLVPLPLYKYSHYFTTLLYLFVSFLSSSSARISLRISFC